MSNISITNFNEICRTCSSKSDLKYLYENIETISMLESFTQMQFNKNDNLPDKICGKCITKISDVFTFINTCKNVDETFRKYLVAHEEVDVKEHPIQECFIKQEYDCEIVEETDVFAPKCSTDIDEGDVSDLSHSDIEDAASNTLTAKSIALYESVFNRFEKWNKDNTITEEAILAYFSEKSQSNKPSTMWSQYSMLRTTIFTKKHIDISKYKNLIGFLKKISKGYRPKKSKIFTKDEINRFLKDANDEIYLMMKVTLIVGLSGGCRRDELCRLMLQNIEDAGAYIKISVPNDKTKVSREFAITSGNIDGVNLLDYFRKYSQLRPKHTNHQRFFVGYKTGKCTVQPIGINTFGNIPKRIATYLGLQHPEEYTGHCFRRSSASLLADVGAWHAGYRK